MKITVKYAVATNSGRVAPLLSGVLLQILYAYEDDFTVVEELKTDLWSPATWARELVERDVTVLVCASVDQFLLGVLCGNGIKVFPCVKGSIDDVCKCIVGGKVKPYEVGVAGLEYGCGSCCKVCRNLGYRK